VERGVASRRSFLTKAAQVSGALALSAAISGCGLVPPGGSKRVARVGIVDSGSATNSLQPVDAFIQGLREAGWIEGDNLILERRYQDGPEDRLPGLVMELVKIPVDVLFVTSTQSAIVAMKATSSAPVVFGGLQDPVSAGLVASLEKPGGNITGTALLTPQLHGKRLELLKATVPGLQKVAILGNPTSAGLNLPEITAAAQPLGLNVIAFEARAPAEFQSVYAKIKGTDAQALMVLPDALFANNRAAVLEQSTAIHMPDSYWLREFAIAGGLMAYGGNRPDSFRLAGSYVDKVLRGARPSEIPVEQPSLFDFVINLRTANALGLTVPETLLTQATELVRVPS
jgi:putative ABC transport system substrate-binding protein